MKQFTEKISDMLLNVLIGHKFPYCESATCADVLDWIIDAGFYINVATIHSIYVLVIVRPKDENIDLLHKEFKNASLKECVEQAIVELAPIFEHE